MDALTTEQRAKFWPISPDVAIEVKSQTDDFRETVAKSALFIQHGTTYAVAIDPTTREVEQFGVRPNGLALDFDAIMDA